MGQYAERLLKFCTPAMDYTPKSLTIVFDSYSQSTIKQLTQDRRGTSGRRIYVTSTEQSMPKGSEWTNFLKNNSNKFNLIIMLANYFQRESIRNELQYPNVVTQEERTIRITKTGIEELENCNHAEADTCIILEVSKSQNPIVVVASDTDIPILLCYVK